jgi:hypothetical protein
MLNRKYLNELPSIPKVDASGRVGGEQGIREVCVGRDRLTRGSNPVRIGKILVNFGIPVGCEHLSCSGALAPL